MTEPQYYFVFARTERNDFVISLADRTFVSKANPWGVRFMIGWQKPEELLEFLDQLTHAMWNAECRLSFPALTWADQAAYRQTGELPPGYEKAAR